VPRQERYINALSIEDWKALKKFLHRKVISPFERVRLEAEPKQVTDPIGHTSMRIVDLFCPIGRGQRALIVSPPKAGKTMLMQHLAHAIRLNNPEIDLLVLLIDERPEEVTDMRRTIKGEVFASSSDSERGEHVRLAQHVLEYAKRKVEAGRDVVILLDSLTRVGRAFNIHQRSSGRTMSGGVDARALEIPKRIFGAARKYEDGGSLTIVATALVETGSRMDELIFQEFKGTGNMELVLDRNLANERIFPSLNISLSGTRREELLFGPAVTQHQALRRSVARMSPRDALLTVLKLIGQYPTNELLLAKF
jgi:transcription termination factor Rho